MYFFFFYLRWIEIVFYFFKEVGVVGLGGNMYVGLSRGVIVFYLSYISLVSFSFDIFFGLVLSSGWS